MRNRVRVVMWVLIVVAVGTVIWFFVMPFVFFFCSAPPSLAQSDGIAETPV